MQECGGFCRLARHVWYLVLNLTHVLQRQCCRRVT